MDIKISVMDRLEAIRQIRADPSLRSAVVIALSAGVLDTEVDEAMAAGFDDYLPKPIDFDALTEMLGEITGSETFTIKPQDDFYVRGVNFGNAINSHGGDVQFLITLTSDFINIYGNADSQIAGFLAERDIEQAERLIHNIAGISGTFGAEDLMETCRKVEREIERTHRSLNQITKSFELNWKTLFPPSRNFSRATQATGTYKFTRSSAFTCLPSSLSKSNNTVSTRCDGTTSVMARNIDSRRPGCCSSQFCNISLITCRCRLS